MRKNINIKRPKYHIWIACNFKSFGIGIYYNAMNLRFFTGLITWELKIKFLFIELTYSKIKIDIDMKKEIEAKDLTLPELRGGNWVYYKDKPRQIYYPYDRGVAFLIGVTWDNKTHTDHILYKGIKPIEITPEILEKAGFERIGNDNYFSFRLSVNAVDELAWYNADQDKCIRYQTKGSGFSRDYNILYLHQLQNLYWCLVGKELEIHL